MCVTILIKNIDKNIPIILANNRDEFITRNFTPPVILNKKPLIVGGKDLQKGGTWLGFNENGIFVNLLNKWTNSKEFYGSDSYRSRGLLLLDLLKSSSLKEVLKKINTIGNSEYLPFFILTGDINKTYFIEYHEKVIKVIEILEDIFICGNINPLETWDKYTTGYNYLNNFQYKEFNNTINKLKILLKYHKGNLEIPSKDYSLNLGDFQTTSSTIFYINKNKFYYYFANGSPLNTDYQDYSFLMNHIKIKEESSG